MAERITVVPADLRQAALEHRATAAQLSAAGASDAEVMASLESLGPIFAEMRDAGRDLLGHRRACYQQQADAHTELADTLAAAADAWERQDAEGARALRDVAGPNP